MIATEKVLQRKDASSVILAIVLGLAVLQFVSAVTNPLVTQLTEQKDFQPPISGADFYVPAAALLLQVVALEIVVWVVILVRQLAYGKTAAKSKKRK